MLERGAALYWRCKANEPLLGLSGTLALPPLEELRAAMREPVKNDEQRRRDLMTRKRLYYLAHRERILAEKRARGAQRAGAGVSGDAQ